MGPPRVKSPRPPSRSRFYEGSMNDRASAAPPVQFLGVDERTSLEKPAIGAFPQEPYSYNQNHFHQPPPLQHQQQHPQQHHQQHHDTDRQPNKKTRLLGQMWDGVWGRLGFRRDNASEEQSRALKQKRAAQEQAEEPSTAAKEDRPSREEVLANYHQLVASGFFSAHAIQSTRRPAPGSANGSGPPPPSRMPPSVPSSRPSSSHRPHDTTPSISLVTEPSLPPAWPLTPPSHRSSAAPAGSSNHPAMLNTASHPSSPIRTPASAASSRGTKRAADSDNDEEMEQLTPRKLRKSASRDMAALPKLRNVGSRRAMLLRRSSSTAGASADNVSAPTAPPQQQQREPARLTKRVLAKLPGQRTLDMPIRRSSTRRNVSECQQQAPPSNGSTRLLRSRNSATEPMRIVPDANRGIPHVPAIPEKFTYGEDRENGGPWRGLRW